MSAMSIAASGFCGTSGTAQLGAETDLETTRKSVLCSKFETIQDYRVKP